MVIEEIHGIERLATNFAAVPNGKIATQERCATRLATPIPGHLRLARLALVS
jgi:hypothetical protein